MFNIKKRHRSSAHQIIVSLLALCIYNSTSLFIISLFLLYTELHTEQKGLSLGSVPFHFTAMHCKRGRGIGSWKGSLHCYLLSERIIIIGVYILSTLLLLQIALRFHNICQGWGSWILLLLRIDSSDDFSHPGLWILLWLHWRRR